MSTCTECSVPLSERVEFASREWCAEADRYLQEQAAQHSQALDGVELSLTERWQNAPPHLGWRNNVAGFSIKIADGAIEVGVGPAAEADTEIDGDYNAILPIAWTIYSGDTKIQARAQREYGHLAGDKSVRMTGAMPSHPGLMPILGGLHDHMARRTINNPDVEHRIEQYGLRSNIEELADQGHTILEGAFTGAMADELRLEGSIGRHWEEMAVHPWVLTSVDQSLGEGAILIGPNLGSVGLGSLTAIWALVDDDSRGLKKGNIVLSQVTPNAAVAGETLHLAYDRAETDVVALGIDVSEDLIERNPPVFRSLCGLDATADV